MAQVKETLTRNISPFWLEALRLVLLALIYWITVRVGLLLVIQPEGISTIWPASGVALAALLLNPQKRWAKMLVVIFVVNLASNWANGNTLPVSLGFALVNILESTLCAWALASLRKTRITFENIADIFALFGAAIFINALTALLGAAVSTLALGTVFFDVWRIWWVSNGLGILLITPIAITWANSLDLRWLKLSGKSLEASLLTIVLTVFAVLVFGPFTIAEQPILEEYMVFPLLVWLAFRFSTRSMANALLVVAGIAVWGTMQHYGIFAHKTQPLTEELIFLQIYLGLITFSGLLLSAIITERKHDAETLKTAEANYRNILENAPVGFFQSSFDGRFITVNPHMARIFGFNSPAEMTSQITDIGQQIYADPASREELKHRLSEKDQLSDFVNQHRRKDGSIFWASTNVRIVKDKNGQPLYLEGFPQDINERIAGEKTIRESQEFVQATMDSLSAHICVLEADGTILAVNKAWIDFGNNNPPAANGGVGANYLSVCDAATGPEAEMAQAFAAGIRAVLIGKQETFELEYPCHAPHEQRWFLGRVMRFADPKSQRVVLAHENITERKRVEDALRQSEASLKFSQQVAHVGHWTWDTVTNRVTWSDEMYRIFGLDPATFDGDLDKVIAQAIHPEDQEKVIRSNNTVLTEQKSPPLEYRVIWPDQSVHTVWAEAAENVIDADGKIVKLSGIVQDITKIKQDQERLRISEEKWRSLFNILPVGISILNTERKVTDYNHALEEILDITGDELRMGTYNQRKYLRANGSPMPPEEFPSQRALQQQIIVQSAQVGVVKEDNTIIWVEMSAAPLSLPDAACVIVTADVTRRKQTEQALQRANQRLSLAQRAAGAGVWEWDMTKDFYTWSPELYELFGVDSAIMPTVDVWRNSIHEQDRQHAESHIISAVQDHLPIADEYRIVRPSGEVRWVNALGNTTYDEQGQPQRMAGICIDITARKQAENTMLESEARLQGIVSSAMDGIIMIDSNQRITLFNNAAEKMFGRSANKVVGQPLDFILPQDKRSIHKKHVEHFGKTGITTRGMSALMEITAQHATGETFPLEASISQFMVTGQKFYTAMVRDVTERKQMEQHLRASLLEKEVLLKEVHHRVKNNLQIVSSLLSMQASSAKNEQVTQALEESKNRVRAMALIHEKLYRAESLEYIQAEEYIPELINNLSSSMAGFRKDRIKFDLQITTATLDIGKAIPCGMIITELISNALKYAFPQGQHGIVQIHLELEEETGKIKLMVSDNGIGLPPEIDFNRPDTLGLELVSILSRQLKAELQIIRQPGTTFILTFRN